MRLGLILLLMPVMATAQSLSQSDLAARINDLSVFRLIGDNDWDRVILKRYSGIPQAGAITIDDCTMTLRLLTSSDQMDLYPMYEASVAIGTANIARIPAPMQTDPTKPYHFGLAAPFYPILQGEYEVGVIAWEHSGGAEFFVKQLSPDIETPSGKVHEVPLYERTNPFVTYFITLDEGENQLRDLVAAYQEYQERFCRLAS